MPDGESDLEPDPGSEPGAGSAGPSGQVPGATLATLAVIVLIAVVVGVALFLADGNEDDQDAGNPPASSTTPSETGNDLPTISEDDFPTDFSATVPTENLPPSGAPTGSAGTGEPPASPDRTGAPAPTSGYSDFPTDPADYESWFQENLEEMAR